LDDFESIKIIGFGKASSRAAHALEGILKDRISEGAVIDKDPYVCDTVIVHRGTHPRPSLENYAATKEIVSLAEKSGEKDLVIVIVSGGGSALLCWPEVECTKGQELYDNFLKSGETIKELNVVRKHLSTIKGGGLAKLLYPATVVSLIFSDIPGNYYDQVASGPTFKDPTTKEEAKEIIEELNLGNFELFETPKEDLYFEKVHNITLVSNAIALDEMANKAKSLGYEPQILSYENYENARDTLSNLIRISSPKSVILAGGEIKLKVDRPGGSGGRNSFLALKAINKIKNAVFVSLASDGTDNGSSAGAIVDENTLEQANLGSINLEESVAAFDSHNILEKINSIIYTGPTGANVSDLIILLNK